MINYIEITDFSAPELDVYARLTEAQLLNRLEPKKGMFIAESPKVICRALDAGCQPVSLLVERNHVNEEAREAIERCGKRRNRDWATIKSAIKNDLSGYLYKTTKRNPMILPVIMEI